MSKIVTQDVFGQALQDYQAGNYTEDLISHSSLEETETVPLPYFFRSFDQMPVLEQKALRLCRGKVLDIGCGTGSHCLYLQKQGLECIGLDNSAGAVKTSRERGVKNVICSTILDFKVGDFDTLLLLMNGTGLAGRLKKLAPFLSHCSSLLAEGGQILVDSSDLRYLYEEDEDGGIWVPGNMAYYGEIDFQWVYKNNRSGIFPWLYVDFNRLKEASESVGLRCEMIMEGPHFDYLAKIW